ncbi:MAG: hypothetical protein FJZ00_01230, partial [Candidatus Sericytochromatia bacterium]|nr:hypothetical protein [Candidatus Tanganyikabacteria bacterium]
PGRTEGRDPAQNPANSPGINSQNSPGNNPAINPAAGVPAAGDLAPSGDAKADAIAPSPMDPGVTGDAEASPKLSETLTPPENPAAKPLSATSADSRRRKKDGMQALCCGWGGGTDVANKVYGYFGYSFANLYWDDYNGTINGTLDGRRVYIADGESYLSGSIGWGTVNLRRKSSWFADTVTGYLGGHYVNMTVNNGSLSGYEGGTYINTGIGWSGALSGSYGGHSVRVTNSSGYLSGYFGYRNVRVSSGYGSFRGYVGNKTVNLSSDMSSSAFLRRLPLMAANDWMVVSTLTEFFD